MSGQRIDDHSSWIGRGDKDSVFPKGVKTKHMRSEEGAGSMGQYEDTSEAIAKQQAMGIAKVHRHEQKAHHRN